jgi:hypothetical protein
MADGGPEVFAELEVCAELEALELALCDREPFLRVAQFWQVVARRV